MAYTPYYSGGWQTGEEGGTPITPAALNHMEEGIQGAMPNRPPAIELVPASGSANGGYIDFHYGGQDVDYTTRIIELVQGILHIYGGLTLGTALGISSGGTGATSTSGAAENLGLALAFNDADVSLDDMYVKMVNVPVPGSVLLWLHSSAASLLSDDKVSSYCTAIASRTNASNWRFMAFTGAAEIYTWTLSGWSSAAATPTVGTVYRVQGTAI